MQDTTAHPNAGDDPAPSAAAASAEDGARVRENETLAVAGPAPLSDHSELPLPIMSPVVIPRGHRVGASGLPVPTMPVEREQEEGDDEVARLEGLLAQRAAELSDERAEHGRLRSLLRDSLERISSAPPPSRGSAELDALRAEHRRALERALEAEAARAEATFRLDEVMGHLLVAAPQRPVPEDANSMTHARLSGTVRGLAAALAESEEARDMANARRMLVEHDLEDSRERVTQLSRKLVEAREQTELAQVQTRVLTARLDGALDARAAGWLRGQMLGTRARADEAERALARVGSEREEQSRTLTDLRDELGHTRAELAARRSEVAALQGRIPELERALAREIEGAREAKAELARRQAECLVLGEELARARAEALGAREQAEQLRAGQARVRDEAEVERSSARQAAAERHARAERMGDALREVRALLGELPSALGRALMPEAQANRDPTLPGTVSAFENASVTSVDGPDEMLRNLEGRVEEAVRALRSLQDTPGALAVRAEISALLRLLELS